MTTELPIDFSKEASKKFLYSILKGLEGEYLVRLKRGKMTDQQRKFYFVAIVKPLADCTGDRPEDCHRYLKGLFLKELSYFNEKATWRIVDLDELDIIESIRYIEDCIQYLAEEWNIIVQDADEYFSSIASKKERYLKKVREILESVTDIDCQCVFDGGRVYFLSEKEFAPWYTPSRAMGGGLILRPMGDGNALRAVKIGSNMYQIRIPEKLAPYKGVKSMSISENKTIIVNP